jgi:hypothetical protein
MDENRFAQFVASKLELDIIVNDNYRIAAHKKEWLFELFRNRDGTRTAGLSLNMWAAPDYSFDGIEQHDIRINIENAEYIAERFRTIIDCPWPCIFDSFSAYSYALHVFKKDPKKYTQIIQFCPDPEKMRMLITETGLWTPALEQIHNNLVVAKRIQ